MIEAIVEIMVQLVGELLIQVFGELLLELGFRGVGESFKREPASPVLALFGHLILGASIGGLSLLVFPESFVEPALRIPNLIGTPIVAGLLFALLGALLRRRGRYTLRIESFGYGFVFAFSLNLIRFLFAA